MEIVARGKTLAIPTFRHPVYLYDISIGVSGVVNSVTPFYTLICFPGDEIFAILFSYLIVKILKLLSLM